MTKYLALISFFILTTFTVASPAAAGWWTLFGDGGEQTPAPADPTKAAE